MTTVISTLTQKWDAAMKETFGVIAMYEIKKIVGMFSGGHDSLLSTYLVSQHPLFHGVVWADTSTGAGETRRYIRETCERNHWELFRGTVHPMRYEIQILLYGFPSPATHRQMYTELKAKSMSKAMTGITTQTHVKRSQVAQVTGLRAPESMRRQQFVKHYHEKRSKTGTLEEILINSIHDWDKRERDDMINHLGLPRNAYADKVGHSYECMCLANQVKGEREYRALISPEYEEIEVMREEIVALFYALQQKKIDVGMIDPDDKVFLSSINITQGWHLWHKIMAHVAEINDPFSLCSGCDMKRAADGTGGVDPDLELQIAMINRAQKQLQVESAS